jgi:hypothetical protein
MGSLCHKPQREPKFVLLEIKEARDELTCCRNFHGDWKRYYVFFREESTNKVHVTNVSFLDYKKRKVVTPSLEVIRADLNQEEINNVLVSCSLDNMKEKRCRAEHFCDCKVIFHAPVLISEFPLGEGKQNKVDMID